MLVIDMELEFDELHFVTLGQQYVLVEHMQIEESSLTNLKYNMLVFFLDNIYYAKLVGEFTLFFWTIINSCLCWSF